MKPLITAYLANRKAEVAGYNFQKDVGEEAAALGSGHAASPLSSTPLPYSRSGATTPPPEGYFDPTIDALFNLEPFHSLEAPPTSPHLAPREDSSTPPPLFLTRKNAGFF